MIDDTFDGIEDAKIYEKNPFFSPGIYDLTVERLLVKNTRKSGVCWIAELAVVSSSNLVAHPVGTKVSVIQKLADKDIAFGNLKRFYYSLLLINETEDHEVIARLMAKDGAGKSLFSKLASYATSPANPLVGWYIHNEAVVIQKQKSVGDFTKNNWEPFNYPLAQIPPVDSFLSSIPEPAQVYGRPVEPYAPQPVSVPRYEMSPDGYYRRLLPMGQWELIRR